jgi:hypothetical protein
VPRAEPFALGKSSLCRELGIWLSAQKRALGRGRVSDSAHNTAATIRAEGRAAFVCSIHRVGMQTDQAVTASSYATPSRALTAGSRRESATGAPHAQEGLALAILLRPRGTRRLASFGSRGTRPSATAAPCGRARRCPADACGGGDVQGRMRRCATG